jgi:hypothetical protein
MNRGLPWFQTRLVGSSAGTCSIGFSSSAPRDLALKSVYKPRAKCCNAWGEKCIMMHDHECYTHFSS